MAGQIITLTSANTYIAIQPLHSKEFSSIEFLSTSVIGGAAMSVQSTTLLNNGTLDFVNIAPRNYITAEQLTDYTSIIKAKYFDTPTFQGENPHLWYIFQLINPGVATAINIRLLNMSTKLIVENA